MKQANRRPTLRTHDALRLVALSRIPRCRECPRLAAMQTVLANGGFARNGLPGPPARCRDPICAPMVRRLEPARSAGEQHEVGLSAAS